MAHNLSNKPDRSSVTPSKGNCANLEDDVDSVADYDDALKTAPLNGWE